MVGSAVYPSAKYPASRPRLSATPASTDWPRLVSASRYDSTSSRSRGTWRGNRLRPCSGRPASTRGSSGGQLGAEIEPFLQVRLPGGELAADREVTPPGPAAPRHRDLHLVRHGQGEELGARGGQLIEQLRGHAVAGHVEEAAVPARRLNLLRHRPGGRPASDHRARATARKRRHVDDRQRRRTCHAPIIASPAARHITGQAEVTCW